MDGTVVGRPGATGQPLSRQRLVWVSRLDAIRACPCGTSQSGCRILTHCDVYSEPLLCLLFTASRTLRTLRVERAGGRGEGNASSFVLGDAQTMSNVVAAAPVRATGRPCIGRPASIHDGTVRGSQ
jgi:hypothetical protein